MYDTNILNHLFDKEVVCPVCGAKFKVKVVKSKSPRILSRDSDFFMRYSVINPYFYDVWICNSCGYSAMKADFEKIKSYKKQDVLDNITPKWSPRELTVISNEHIAIKRYKLALLTAVLANLNDSTKAMILLKMAWMYRLLEDTSNEKQYIKQAIDCFSSTYYKEDLPVYGLQRDSLIYLLGNLNYRIDNKEEALKWISKVLTSFNSSYRVKDMARNLKYEIKGQDK
ncbi:DUF2225 domain-containing protein [Clostridium sp. BJN0001]|uniref:DUF2225 domain-containing protein n=1 Tax=Clostridium sp. BJN0001 TaxID=2930219 RepID=UPI001FD04CD5|nr:DUF2225 domain-containing protein [Clostridium sp. BJN0001]